MYDNPSLRLAATDARSGQVHWRCPSNLAIVKYWGKHGVQLPRNPSISLTLDAAYTDTQMAYAPKATGGISLDFTFEGQPRPAFQAKMVRFLDQLRPIFPFVEQLHFTVASHNSFPHSAGIASSASSMAALALCLCSVEQALFGTLADEGAFMQKASYIARLGSGSASRSVYGVAAMWGASDAVADASDLYAIPFAHRVHEVFKGFHDTILIASRGEKSVSSTAGHQLMEGNIYAASRYEQARNRCRDLADILVQGDVTAFGEMAEDEALTLHALMMCSKPSYMLMRPASLEMIERVRAYRQDTGQALYFSLDAGPNLHLLYPHEIHGEVSAFIASDLAPLCEDGFYIEDRVGDGPNIL